MSSAMERLLDESVEHYSALYRHAEMLAKMMASTDLSDIESHIIELENMQQKARQNDVFLLEGLAEDPSIWKRHPLFLRRLELIQAIIDLNADLIPRLHGMMAVAKEERNRVSEGRIAVAGYGAAANMPTTRLSRTA